MSLLWKKGGMQVYLFCPICTGWMVLGGHHRPPESKTWSSGGSTSRWPSKWHFAPSPAPTSSRCLAATWPLLCRFALPRLKLEPPPVPTSASPFRWQSHIGSLLGSQVRLCLAPLFQGWPCASAESLLAGLPRLPSTSSLSLQQSLHRTPWHLWIQSTAGVPVPVQRWTPPWLS